MTHASLEPHAGRLAGLGVLLSLPALVLVVSGLLQTATGHEVFFPPQALVHPVPVLGGLLAALALNALPTLRLAQAQDASAVVLRLEIRRRAANLVVLALAAGLLAALLLYAFGENFAFTPH